MASPRNQRPANVSYYGRNRAAEIARIRRRQDATRDFLRELRRGPCADCHKSFEPHQMDFDHRDPATKSFRLTAGRAMLARRARLMTEVKKCDVVCANCHRVRAHARQRELLEQLVPNVTSAELARKRAYWRGQARMLDRLRSRPCSDCGGMFAPCAMDFDHRDAAAKRYTISRMIGRAGTRTIIAEIAKCDIVCANCHRDRTYRRRVEGLFERE